MNTCDILKYTARLHSSEKSHDFDFFKQFYNKRDDLDFAILNFPFLDGDVPRRASYGVLGLRQSAIMQRTSTREISV